MGVFEKVAEFFRAYPGEKRVYGRSEEGAPLFAFRAGSGSPTAVVQCAMHAREYVTAGVGLRMLCDFLASPPEGTVWTIPLANPDGVRIAEEGVGWLSAARRDLLGSVRRGRDYRLFKANADGVDLNVNFDARWGTGEHNVFFPDFSDFVGPAPFSAAETRAIADFTRSVAPDGTVSFHAKGEVIYWEFGQTGEVRARDERIARRVSAACGYPLGDAGVSSGGYKDWCVSALGIPAITVEVGRDELRHPVEWDRLDEIYASARRVTPAFLEAIGKERPWKRR